MHNLKAQGLQVGGPQANSEKETFLFVCLFFISCIMFVKMKKLN